MGIFGKAAVFGKRRDTSLRDLKNMDWNRPDSDGKLRTFSRELWDDPKVGALLRSVGLEPDDPRNIRKTMEDRRVDLARAKERLDRRVADFNADFTRLYGHCAVAPFLMIDAPIWEGPHGGFLSGQLDLCPYDDWNVLLLGTDEKTIRDCPVLPHVGREPNLLAAMQEVIKNLHARYDFGLEHFGLTATGQQGGITRDQWESLQKEIMDVLMTQVDHARRVFSANLEKFAADIRSGKVRV